MNFLAQLKLFLKKLFQQDDSFENSARRDEEYIADTKASMLTKSSSVANSIIYIVSLFFIVCLIWASFSEIDVVVIATGKVIPSSHVKNIQSLDGGIVKKVLVEEGHLVKKDQALIILDNTRYKSDYEKNYYKMLALQAMIARLQAELVNKKNINFPLEIIQHYPEFAEREKSLFEARQKAYRDQITNLEHNYFVSKSELKTNEDAYKEGIVSKIDYLRGQRVVGEEQEKIYDLKSKHYEEINASLVKATEDLNSLGEELKGLRDKMDRTILRSPVNGIVKKINVSAEYEVISPSMIIMEVVPLEDTLLIQGRVQPSDIAFVHKGQKAIVQITAYDYSIYGHLDGIVEYVSADTIEETKPGSIDKTLTSYYYVKVRTTHNYLGTNKHQLQIFPGMDANIKIITGRKSIMHYILKPLVKAKEEALKER